MPRASAATRRLPFSEIEFLPQRLLRDVVLPRCTVRSMKTMNSVRSNEASLGTLFRPQLLAAAVALGTAAQAQAVNFNIGEIEGQFDSSLSVGASWAVRGADPDFISPNNVLGKRGEAGSAT